MPKPVIVSAVRTAIGTSFKGSSGQHHARVPRDHHPAGSGPAVRGRRRDIDDVIFAESHYGGGDHGALRRVGDSGMTSVPGQAVNRHCAGSLTAVANAAAQIGSGAEKVVVGGGVQSLSMTPMMNWRIPGPTLEFEERWIPPTHVETPDAPGRDMSITVGWNTAQAVGISREEMDAWAFRSHQRAIAAIDSGAFVDEIVPLKIKGLDDALVEFSVDEHPRRETSLEKLASLKVLHPEIEGFSITAGNSSGTNDAAAALTSGRRRLRPIRRARRCWARSRPGPRPPSSRRTPVWAR